MRPIVDVLDQGVLNFDGSKEVLFLGENVGFDVWFGPGIVGSALKHLYPILVLTDFGGRGNEQFQLIEGILKIRQALLKWKDFAVFGSIVAPEGFGEAWEKDRFEELVSIDFQLGDDN